MEEAQRLGRAPKVRARSGLPRGLPGRNRARVPRAVSLVSLCRLARMETVNESEEPTMHLSREEARRKHSAETGHADYVETMYGVVCSACHNYIVIDFTNCPPT